MATFMTMSNTPKKYKIKKLDRRHKGYGHFTYIVEPPLSGNRTSKVQQFQAWREWCWSTFGPSMERNFIDLNYNNVEYKWTWFTDEYDTRIYLKSDKELNWFVLTWSDVASPT